MVSWLACQPWSLPADNLAYSLAEPEKIGKRENLGSQSFIDNLPFCRFFRKFWILKGKFLKTLNFHAKFQEVCHSISGLCFFDSLI